MSPERRRVARENVPWEQVSQPVSLAIEFRKLVLRALGEPMDFKCATPELDDALDFTSPPLPSSKKRKPVIDLLVAEKKPNLKNWTPTATDSGSKGSEELILSKQEVGETTSTVEMRKDPKGVESMAHVKTTSSKKTVIKRIVLGKSIVVETRIMSSSVEQVTFNET